MQERMQMDQVIPQAYKAMLGLEQYVRANVPKKLHELIKLRASVLNGCAYCVDMHATDALGAGESARRLFAVSAWRESPFFSRTERAALALTDAITRLGSEGVPDAVWAEAQEIGSEADVANVVIAIVAINAWNRIAVTVHKQPPPEASAQA